MIKTIRSLCALALLPWVTACVSFTSTLEPDERRDPAEGYIYGRFTLSTPNPGELHHRMGLRLEQTDGSESITIEFVDEPKKVSVFAVKPGTYAFRKIIYAKVDYESAGSRELPSSPSLTFRVEPEKAYYIGDFHGSTSARFASRGVLSEWQLDSFVSNYEETTADLKRDFPALKDLETVESIPPAH
jgi:hypothetical protein